MEEIEEDQNNSAILEESTVQIRHINKTESFFDKRNRSTLPLDARIRELVTQIQ